MIGEILISEQDGGDIEFYLEDCSHKIYMLCKLSRKSKTDCFNIGFFSTLLCERVNLFILFTVDVLNIGLNVYLGCM